MFIPNPLLTNTNPLLLHPVLRNQSPLGPLESTLFLLALGRQYPSILVEPKAGPRAFSSSLSSVASLKSRSGEQRALAAKEIQASLLALISLGSGHLLDSLVRHLSLPELATFVLEQPLLVVELQSSAAL